MRYGSTAHHIHDAARYAMPVPHTSQHHTLWQYGTWAYRCWELACASGRSRMPGSTIVVSRSTIAYGHP
eukprot:2150807-Rhodomonas_salina.9